MIIVKLFKIFKRSKNQKIIKMKWNINYYKYLEIKQVSFEHITNCYGWINTNLGKVDFDRIEFKTQLTYIIKNKLFG